MDSLTSNGQSWGTRGNELEIKSWQLSSSLNLRKRPFKNYFLFARGKMCFSNMTSTHVIPGYSP